MLMFLALMYTVTAGLLNWGKSLRAYTQQCSEPNMGFVFGGHYC